MIHLLEQFLDKKETVTQIWNSFTAEDCRKLLDPLLKQIKAVLKQKGDVT